MGITISRNKGQKNIKLLSFTKKDRDENFYQEDKGKIVSKMDVNDKTKSDNCEIPQGSSATDNNAGTSEDVAGAQVGIIKGKDEKLMNFSTDLSQNSPSQNETCHDNGATATGTSHVFTVPNEGGGQAGETDFVTNTSTGAGDKPVVTEKCKSSCSDNGTSCHGMHDDVNHEDFESVNASFGDQNSYCTGPNDVGPDVLKSPDPECDEKSSKMMSDGTSPTDVKSADVMSDDAEPTDGNGAGVVQTVHEKAGDESGIKTVATLDINDDDNGRNNVSTETKSGEETLSGRSVEERDEESEKQFDTSEANESEEDSLNLCFYRNEIYSKPFPGEKIDGMLEWKGNYLLLERSHSYIQWLFPIPEGRGMNYSAQALQEHEAQAIREDETLRARVLKAFKMMLDFYGMELADDKTGEVKRADNWEERYEHLDRSFHNRFRITRILKALGELGFEHLQKPWLEFIMREATVNNALPGLNGGCMYHWIDAIKDEDEHSKLYILLFHLTEQLNTCKQQDNEYGMKVDDKNPAGGKEADSNSADQNEIKDTEAETSSKNSTEVKDHVTERDATETVENHIEITECESSGRTTVNVEEMGADKNKNSNDKSRHTEEKIHTEKISKTENHVTSTTERDKQDVVGKGYLNKVNEENESGDNVVDSVNCKNDTEAEENEKDCSSSGDLEETLHNVNADKDRNKGGEQSGAKQEFSDTRDLVNSMNLHNQREENNVKKDESHLSNGAGACESAEGSSENGLHGDDNLNGSVDKENKNESKTNESVNTNSQNSNKLTSEIW